ncbi:chymotrypsin-2 [Papilio machaon]|uniref:chymotrypsin-2 n=1 Tax=Papilio machaon TaxID=76193 RepID=UPI001E6635C0|nr:chymotrypsin-2 [Papilio machaon]
MKIMFFQKSVRFNISFYCLLWIGFLSMSEGFSPRLIGGERAPQEFGRFHGSLQNLTGHHVCGSAVISRRHLLTAAHCVYRVKPRYIKVIVGTVDLNKGGKQYGVKSIHLYPEYNITRRINDIAIVKIRGRFNLNYIDVLQLPKRDLQDGDPIILSGFGAKKPYGDSSRKMYALNLTVFCQKTCRYAMRYSRDVTDTMFCTFTRIGEGTCHGDSGSPLIKDNVLVGLVSWGIPCAMGFPDVHTRVYPYLKWIKSIIFEKQYKTLELKTEVKLTLSK